MDSSSDFDRNGDRITCKHSQHYGDDGFPICHDGSQGRRCEGYTVQCGKGHAPCERHADRRDTRPLAVENVERAVAQGVGSALPVVEADDDEAGTYTVTLKTSEIVALEIAMEARHDTLRKLRHELVDGGHDTASIDTTIEKTARLIAKLKRQPADSAALSAMLTSSRGR